MDKEGDFEDDDPLDDVAGFVPDTVGVADPVGDFDAETVPDRD